MVQETKTTPPSSLPYSSSQTLRPSVSHRTKHQSFFGHTIASARRLEVVLCVVFLLCLVQFVWLTRSLMWQQHHEATHSVDASAATSSTIRSLYSFRRQGSSSENSNNEAPNLSVLNFTPRHGVNGGKRRRKGARPARWDPGEGLKEGPKPLKIGLPVFVASLPKSGTTSIWQYFQCGGWPASHQWTKVARNDSEHQLIGKCVYDNVHTFRRRPFEGCGDHAIYTDTGYARFHVSDGPTCYYPSISALESIYEHYPNATIVLVVRETSSWASSMMQWGNGTLVQRWRACSLQHLSWPAAEGDVAAAKAAVERFYEWHNQHVRDFVRMRGMSYVEVALESNQTGQQLQERIGLPASCWGKCTPLSKFCQRLTSPS